MDQPLFRLIDEETLLELLELEPPAGAFLDGDPTAEAVFYDEPLENTDYH